MASDLCSKLLAAGLSAGLFLIWWPQHHATTGLTSLIVRGVLWTLGYELMLLAFTPLERLLRRALSARVHRIRLSNRFSAVPGAARAGGAAALACAGVAVPVALLAGANAPGPAAISASTHRVIVVKRPVVKRVVVRETVTVPAAAAHPSLPAVASAPAATATKSGKTTATRKRRTTQRRTTATTKKTTPAAATTPVPASTTPATATAPAAGTTPAAPATTDAVAAPAAG
jgi:hypothetical protein